MSPAPLELKLPESEKPVSADGSSIEKPDFSHLRGVQWRIDLGALPSVSFQIDDIRRVAADSRRRYAGLRRRLLIDPHVPKDVDKPTDLVIDNPLSQNPDSTWSRFFRSAELEKMVDQDLSRLYPEHGSYFQTPACQAMLRRILLLWCLRHPETGYRQGMHELLAPLLYVLHVDVQCLIDVRKQYGDHFNDKYDGLLFEKSNLAFTYMDSHVSSDWPMGNDVEHSSRENAAKICSLDELDPKIRTIVLISDAYGAEGELGILLSERFIEHDAYCMFDALMTGGAGGVVAMSAFFSPSPSVRSLTGLPPVIESSSALYSLLSVVDSSLHSHLIALGVEPQYFALRWLRVLFGREFILGDLLFIWDSIFSSPNSSSIVGPGQNSQFQYEILSSPRGAFISAMAVSMLLHLRSSLLATENATSCLQRLLNFPENVDVKKLVAKANNLQALALDMDFSPSSFSPGFSERSKSVIPRAFSLSPRSTSPRTPANLMPESYWEEKWRSSVLHKADSLPKGSSTGSTSTRNRRLNKEGSNIARTESEPSPSKNVNERKSARFSSRRRLIDDLARALGSDETDFEKLGADGVSDTNGDMEKGSDEEQTDGNGIEKNYACLVEEPCLSGLAASEDNSSIFSSSTRAVDHENDSEKSSITTQLSLDGDDDEVTGNLDEQYSSEFSDPTRTEAGSDIDGAEKQETHESDIERLEKQETLGSDIEKTEKQEILGSNTDKTEKQESVSRERKAPSGKFPWFWKFGRNTEGTSEKGNGTESQKLGNEEDDRKDSIGESVVDHGFNGDSADKNVMGTIRNLGQSMLENIQVIELAFQQDRYQVGSLENLSRNILAGKGQVTAMAALKELRKISNLLSEIPDLGPEKSLSLRGGFSSRGSIGRGISSAGGPRS